MGSICGPTSIQLPNQSGPPPEVMQNYRDLVNQAKTASANLPGLPGPPVAPLTQQQLGGINNVDLTTGMAAPYFAQGLAGLTSAQGTVADAGKYIPQAAGMIGAGSGYYGTGASMATEGAGNVTPMAFSNQALQQYMSPYTQNVIDSTMANIQRTNDIQQNNLRGSAILGGNAFGGDRAGIAAAELARNQDMASNQTMANLWNQNYSQALGEFNTQQGVDLGAQENNMARKLQAAGLYGSFGSGMGGLGGQYGNLASTQGGLGATQGNLSGTIAGLGSQATNTALASALAQIQAGGIAQGTYQNQANSDYQSLINSLGLSTPGYLAPFVLGAGAQSGTEGYTTQAGPSLLTQIGGIGAGLVGLKNAKNSNSGGRIVGYDDGGAVDDGGGYSLGDMESANAMVRDFLDAQQANQHLANLQQGIGFAEGGMALPGFAGLNLEGFNGAPLPIYRAGLAGLFRTGMPAAGRRGSSQPSAPPPQLPNEGQELGSQIKTIAPWLRDKLSSDEPGKPLSLDPEGMAGGGYVSSGYSGMGTETSPQLGGPGPQVMPQAPGMPSAGYKPDFFDGFSAGNPTQLPVGLGTQNPPEGMTPPGAPAQGFTMPNTVQMLPRGYGMASARPMMLQRPMRGQPQPWGGPGMGVRPQMQGLSGIPGLGGMAGHSAGGVAGSGRVFESRGYADEALSFDSRSGSGNAFDPADYGDFPDEVTGVLPGDSPALRARMEQRAKEMNDAKTRDEAAASALKSYGTRSIGAMNALPPPPYIDATDVVLRNQPPPGTEVKHDSAALAADRTLDGPAGVKSVSYRAPVQPPDAAADTPMRSAAPSRDPRAIDEITTPSAPPLPLAPPGLGGLDESSTKGKVDPWLALAAFGFGTAAGNSPWFGVNIGRGGLAAVQNIADQREQTRQDMTVANRAKQLEEQAARWRAELARQTSRDESTMGHQLAMEKNASRTADIQEAYRKFEMSTPKTIEDPLLGRRSIMHNGKEWVDASTQKPISEPPGAMPANIPPSDDPNRPFKMAKATVETMTTAKEQGLRGQAFLDAVPLQFRNGIEATANYQAPLSTFSKRAGAGMSQDKALEYVKQANPEFDPAWYKVKEKALNNFYASTAAGSPVMQARAYNTAAGHAGDLAEAIQELHQAGDGELLSLARESNTPFMSRLAAAAQQKMKSGTAAGSPWAKVAAIVPLYSAETAKFYSNTGGTQKERDEIQAPLNVNGSLPEFMSALKAQAHMFKSKTDPLEQEFRDALDAPGLKEYGTNKPVKEWHATKERAQKAIERIDEIESSARRAKGSPAGPGSGRIHVKTLEEASKLPKGTRITLPDGSPGIVP